MCLTFLVSLEVHGLKSLCALLPTVALAENSGSVSSTQAEAHYHLQLSSRESNNLSTSAGNTHTHTQLILKIVKVSPLDSGMPTARSWQATQLLITAKRLYKLYSFQQTQKVRNDRKLKIYHYFPYHDPVFFSSS